MSFALQGTDGAQAMASPALEDPGPCWSQPGGSQGRSLVQAGGLVAGFLHRSHQAGDREAGCWAQTVSRVLILALCWRKCSGHLGFCGWLIILNDREEPSVGHSVQVPCWEWCV